MLYEHYPQGGVMEEVLPQYPLGKKAFTSLYTVRESGNLGAKSEVRLQAMFSAIFLLYLWHYY